MKPAKKEINKGKRGSEESCCESGCSSEHGKAKKESCCGGCCCG